MATIIEVLSKMAELGQSEEISMQFINNTLMEVKASTKRKPASLKIAVDDETASSFLTFGDYKEVGLMLMIDKEKFYSIAKMIDEQK